MWAAKSEKLADKTGLKFSLALNSSPVTYLQVLELWQHDQEFRSFFNDLLANCQFRSFRWETPPITSRTAKDYFEFVILDSPELERTPDLDAFASHFQTASSGQLVLEFPNLGGDATLVVPCPKGEDSSYCQLGSFVRSAPEQQRHALWEMVGGAMERRVNDRPVWLSTAGAGVSWLHVRLDDRPKYYGYSGYRFHK